MRHKQRVRQGKKGAYIGIFGSILLSAVNLSLGIFGNSYALIAESFHTFSDALSSIVVLAGFYVVSKPADEKHPLGHGDAEALAGFVVSILIVLIGFEVGKNSYQRFLQPPTQGPDAIALAGPIISIAGGLIMARLVSKIGRKINSPSLMADSINHTSDAVSSGIVLVGIFFSRTGYPILDPLAGLIVGLFIIKTGFDVGRGNIDMLMGSVPDTGLINQITNLALDVDGVKGVHSLKIHYVGVVANVQMHIEVDKDMFIIDADRLAHKVQAKVVSELDEVVSVLIHVCPFRGEDRA
ncbi:MAG TPA: cation transporter [Euryarchaeota archaeon]|nr:putative cation efflux system protein/MT2084 [archaeon BMS3Bbin16]HDH28190.1 cation transporter [Euryarchaeota archaeon]